MENQEKPRIPGRKRDRSTPRTSPRTLWTAGLALIAVILVITRLNGDASPIYSKIVIGLAVLFLIIRQLSRRSDGKGPRAAEPDPRSRLNLD